MSRLGKITKIVVYKMNRELKFSHRAIYNISLQNAELNENGFLLCLLNYDRIGNL